MMAQDTQAKSGLDAGLVNNLSDAVIQVLGTMVGTPTHLKEVLPSLDYTPTGDVTSLIGISGEHGEGMLALSFTADLARLLVARLLGLAPEDLADEDLIDGVGELINMISGRAKIGLSESSGSLYRLSLPQIIVGANHQISSPIKNTPFLFLVFEADGYEFGLQVSFRSL
jgi:chemotaxis protein CheX